jgi:tricorn protease
VFTSDGKHLAFLSYRSFDPVYDAHSFDLSFPNGCRPFLVPLAARTPSPFGPSPDGRPVGGSDSADGPDSAVSPTGAGGVDGPGGASGSDGGDGAETAAESTPDAEPVTNQDASGKGASGNGASGKDTSGKGTKDSVPKLVVDLEGLIDRVVAVPVGEARYYRLRAGKDCLLWLRSTPTGVLGDGLAEGAEGPRPTLERYDLNRRRHDRIADPADTFEVSGDGTRIVVRDRRSLRVLRTDRSGSDKPGDENAEEFDIDLSRIAVTVDPTAEWRQMYDEAGRLMRDHFWVEDMGGVDWDDVLERYLPLADEIAARDDLSEVLWEMIGELGSSHAYERFEFPPPPKGRGAAFLGADLARDGDGRWVITRVLPSESSVPAARSPLRAAGANVQDGDVLLEVNGREVGAAGPGPLLAGLAGKPVELTIAREGKPRIVVAIPTADETPIRYQEWVSDRRATVHDAGDGRIGYVHVPDMTSTGWAEFNRDLRREIARDALVVDTRDNGGGHVSELVIERLARRPLGGNVARHAPEDSYPSGAPRGPMVSLANEHAGSDGDIVNEAFHELALGQIIGVRTWGGVIGIDGRYDLIDGTVVTQPRYSFWFRDVGWGVENYGVDPDIEVPHPPQAWASGDDPQLTEGLRVLTEELATATPLNPPPVSTRPDRSAPSLPPR